MKKGKFSIDLAFESCFFSFTFAAWKFRFLSIIIIEFNDVDKARVSDVRVREKLSKLYNCILHENDQRGEERERESAR